MNAAIITSSVFQLWHGDFPSHCVEDWLQVCGRPIVPTDVSWVDRTDTRVVKEQQNTQWHSWVDAADNGWSLRGSRWTGCRNIQNISETSECPELVVFNAWVHRSIRDSCTAQDDVLRHAIEQFTSTPEVTLWK